MIELNNPKHLQSLPPREVAPVGAEHSCREERPKWRAFLHRAFVAPLVSSKHPPWFDARGIAVGLAIGFGVPIGAQTVTLGLLRLAFRFNAVIAFLFTWVNNPITLIPMYYGYYCLGSLVLGRTVVMDVEAFRQLMNPMVRANYFWEAAQAFLLLGWDAVLRWCVAAFLVAATSGIVGYVVGYRVQKARCMRNAHQMGIPYEKFVERLEPSLLKGDKARVDLTRCGS